MSRRGLAHGLAISLGLVAGISATGGSFHAPMEPIGLSIPCVADPTAQPAQSAATSCAGHTVPHGGGIGSPDKAGLSAESDSLRTRDPLRHTVAGATAEKESRVMASRRHRAPVRLIRITLAASGEHGVPFHILAGLAEDESTWREKAVGQHGEQGLLQLNASTAAWCGGNIDRLDAVDNMNCGARWLYAQFERFGTWELAVVAFKAGPETIPERIPASSWAFAQRALLKAEAYR